MGDSSKIMGKISALTNIKEIAAITTNMQTNLAKLGIMGEMVEDAMGDMDDDRARFRLRRWRPGTAGTQRPGRSCWTQPQ
jgi:hypothetical protein